MGCSSSHNNAKVDTTALMHKIKDLKRKYHLIDFAIDTKRIYGAGDVSTLTRTIVDKTLPEKEITVSEALSRDGKFYIATLVNDDITFQMHTHTDKDRISSELMTILYDIPVVFNSDKRYYMVNPAIGLTGKDAWYFCGTEKDLREAREEGLPLIFPDENPTETPEYKLYSDNL